MHPGSRRPCLLPAITGKAESVPEIPAGAHENRPEDRFTALDFGVQTSTWRSAPRLVSGKPAVSGPAGRTGRQTHERSIQPHRYPHILRRVGESGEDARPSDRLCGLVFGSITYPGSAAPQVTWKAIKGERSDRHPSRSRSTPVIAPSGLAADTQRGFEPGGLTLRPLNAEIFQDKPDWLTTRRCGKQKFEPSGRP